MSQSLDYAAFGAAMIGLLGTIIGMIVWMVKLSAKRSQEITDRFIKHLEDASAAKAREDVERASERAQFLEALRHNTESTERVAERLSDIVAEVRILTTEVRELATEVANIKSAQSEQST